jgi:hypothetical protein
LRRYNLDAVTAAIDVAGGNPGPWKESLGDYWKERLVIADTNIKDLQAQAGTYSTLVHFSAQPEPFVTQNTP